MRRGGAVGCPQRLRLGLNTPPGRRRLRCLAPHEAWITGEFHRGFPPALAGAGRALAGYDGRSLASRVDVPCAMVLTTRDHLVRPVKQRELARATRARVFEVDGDHFAPFSRGPQFSAAIRAAVDHVARDA